MLEKMEIIITPFQRKRTVRIYLPDDYHQNDTKRYPVLYMHDGQNLFHDEDASYGMSWRISDFLNSSDIELIVVGIDCSTEGYQRLDEYAPWKSTAMRNVFPDAPDEMGGQGKAYIDFIVDELKPMIDSTYRTQSEDTSMAGSSMGGLISTYAACAYPHIFKRIASVSSAYWVNQEEIENLIRHSDLSSIVKFYLDVGTHESQSSTDSQRYVESSQAVYEVLKQKVKDCKFEIVQGAIHNEIAWRERIPSIFTYLYK